MSIGFKIPAYPSPPEYWIKQRQNDACTKTLLEDTIYFDNLLLPSSLPAYCSFELLKYKERENKLQPVHGIKLVYKDLESFLPLKNYEPTIEGFHVVGKSLCNYQKNERGWKLNQLPIELMKQYYDAKNEFEKKEIEILINDYKERVEIVRMNKYPLTLIMSLLF
jgi:hypothetical protein